MEAHEAVKTIDCKVPGCTSEALTQFGTYGKLCARHKLERRRELGMTGDGAAPRPRLAVVPAGSREAQARELVALGRKVDAARARAAKVRAKLEPALNALRDAEAEWARAVAGLTDPHRPAGDGE